MWRSFDRGFEFKTGGLFPHGHTPSLGHDLRQLDHDPSGIRW